MQRALLVAVGGGLHAVDLQDGGLAALEVRGRALRGSRPRPQVVATWALCVTNSLPGRPVAARRASKVAAHRFFWPRIRSRMRSADAVPLVIPQPSKPQAVKTW